MDDLPAGHCHVAIDALDHAAFAQDEDVVAGDVATVTYRLDRKLLRRRSSILSGPWPAAGRLSEIRTEPGRPAA